MNNDLLKRIESLEKKIKDLETKNKSLFGRSYDQIGSSNSDFIIKTKGQVKIQYGSKFIDLIKDGKINADSNFIYKSKSVGSKNGFYVLEDGSVWLVVSNSEPISIASSEIGTTYVSFLGEQETTSDNKHQALVNIGFLYPDLLSIDESSLKNGIIYIESEHKLYIVIDGQLQEYTIEIPNPFTEQFVIAKNDSEKGSLYIQGIGIENSLAFDKAWIYNDNSYLSIKSELPILFNILDKDILQMSKDKVTSKVTLEADYIQSKDASNRFGFKLYSIGNKSTLEVDNLIVRNKEKSDIALYPEFWLWYNNIINSCSYLSKQGDNTEEDNTQEDIIKSPENTSLVQISLQYPCKYEVGDILIVYKNPSQDIKKLNDSEDSSNSNVEEDLTDNIEIVQYIPIYLTVTEIGDTITATSSEPFSEDELDQLQGSFIFLYQRENGYPIRIKDNTIDIIKDSELNTRIGPLEVEVTNGTIGSNQNEVIETPFYSKTAIFGLAKYKSDTIVPSNDDSSTLATTEWVNKKILSQFKPGYYYAKDFKNGYPESPEYIGTTNQDFQVSEEIPYLLYTNDGITWSIISEYIPPVPNRIYILSTNLSSYTDLSTNQITRWPSGFLCYYNNGQSVSTPFGKSNYVPVVSSYDDQIPQIPYINNLLQQAESGQVPQKSGYSYLWSILETEDKSNPMNWSEENNGTVPVTIVYEETSDWGNSSVRPGLALWEINPEDETIIGVPSESEFIIGNGTEENWQNPIWRKSFLEAILGSILTRNIINYDHTLGWNFNYSGIIKSTGYAGYWSSRTGALLSPDSDDENDQGFLPTSVIGTIYGQVMDMGETIQFTFTNVKIGKMLPYRYGYHNNSIGDKLTQELGQLFDASYEKCFYKRYSDYQEFSS